MYENSNVEKKHLVKEGKKKKQMVTSKKSVMQKRGKKKEGKQKVKLKFYLRK